MPKTKTFLPNKNKKKKEETKLDTADDYQAAGVELEEAAGKHRAGDAVKSLRFFERAINVYDEGLRKFPDSFDLAYNKARVQYEVATHPKLAKQLQQPLQTLFRIALASHEDALRLDENDADLLFNTAQVLTSLAEELANDGLTQESINLLSSAQNIQSRCLVIQEQKYAEALELEREAREIFEAPPDDNYAPERMEEDGSSDTVSSKPTEDGQWASVLEPITVDTLVDTILACFGTMTTLCTTVSTSRYPGWETPLTEIEARHTHLKDKIGNLPLTEPEKLQELSLADSILQSAMLDASFILTSAMTAATYKSALEALWSAEIPHLSLLTTVPALLAHADALFALNFSLSTNQRSLPDPDYRWTVLTTTIQSLTNASRLPSITVEDKAKTHFLRGDASLLQHRLSTTHKQAAANAETLLKNAQVFYRNAAQLSGEQEDRDRAASRGAVVQYLIGGAAEAKSKLAIGDMGSVAEELQNMIDEGLVQEGMDLSRLQ